MEVTMKHKLEDKTLTIYMVGFQKLMKNEKK